MRSFTYLSVTTLLASTVLGQPSDCPDQQYQNLPGFPAVKSGCYPTTYVRASDLGNTNPSDAQARCQQQCTADSNCGSIVASLNKAADSDNYSGTCFFFARGQAPTGPRPCGDATSLLVGRVKVDCDAVTTTTSSTVSPTTSSTTSTTTSTTTTTPTTSTSSSSSSSSSSTTTTTSDATTTTTSTTSTGTTTADITTSTTMTMTTTTTTTTSSTTTTASATPTACTVDPNTQQSTCAVGLACVNGVCQQPSPCTTPVNDVIYFCSADQTCTCYTTTEGRGYCDFSPPGNACGQTCTTSSDCPNGSVCETAATSGCPGNSCSFQACPNPAVARMLLRGRMAKRYADGQLKKAPAARMAGPKARPHAK